ncbi:hypothetical protein F5Y17DRAFT_431470 [Xylariaceae sp. FL0594]|nr:hypothetical protein F5Y17DRAFT_431470 [Xylariaceae sp. FL0594]
MAIHTTTFPAASQSVLPPTSGSHARPRGRRGRRGGGGRKNQIQEAEKRATTQHEELVERLDKICQFLQAGIVTPTTGSQNREATDSVIATEASSTVSDSDYGHPRGGRDSFLHSLAPPPSPSPSPTSSLPPRHYSSVFGSGYVKPRVDEDEDEEEEQEYDEDVYHMQADCGLDTEWEDDSRCRSDASFSDYGCGCDYAYYYNNNKGPLQTPAFGSGTNRTSNADFDSDYDIDLAAAGFWDLETTGPDDDDNISEGNENARRMIAEIASARDAALDNLSEFFFLLEIELRETRERLWDLRAVLDACAVGAAYPASQDEGLKRGGGKEKEKEKEVQFERIRSLIHGLAIDLEKAVQQNLHRLFIINGQRHWAGFYHEQLLRRLGLHSHIELGLRDARQPVLVPHLHKDKETGSESENESEESECAFAIWNRFGQDGKQDEEEQDVMGKDQGKEKGEGRDNAEEDPILEFIPAGKVPRRNFARDVWY